jgi:hypothetical protein
MVMLMIAACTNRIITTAAAIHYRCTLLSCKQVAALEHALSHRVALIEANIHEQPSSTHFLQVTCASQMLHAQQRNCVHGSCILSTPAATSLIIQFVTVSDSAVYIVYSDCGIILSLQLKTRAIRVRLAPVKLS